ncbi:MAG: hypothetical protein F4Z46_00030 [Cenarchaeum sp. SB0667_bin_13]|nr:hypothetical protein [Cenarchaeum sp. SB0667_bin_13]
MGEWAACRTHPARDGREQGDDVADISDLRRSGEGPPRSALPPTLRGHPRQRPLPAYRVGTRLCGGV